MSGDNHTEHVQEEIHEHAHGGHGPRWISAAALTAAILAALAAITGSQASVHLTASSRSQIEANDHWSYYQAKSIKQNNLESRIEILSALGRPEQADRIAKDRAKIEEYKREQDEIRTQARHQSERSEAHLRTHETLEFGVMLFHISIAIVAVAVLTRLRPFWYLSMACGVVGVYFLTVGMLQAPAHAQGHGEHEGTAPATHSAPAHSAPAPHSAPAAPTAPDHDAGHGPGSGEAHH